MDQSSYNESPAAQKKLPIKALPFNEEKMFCSTAFAAQTQARLCLRHYGARLKGTFITITILVHVISTVIDFFNYQSHIRNAPEITFKILSFTENLNDQYEILNNVQFTPNRNDIEQSSI